MGNFSNWKEGMRDGIPIALAYFAVAFAFGISAVRSGLLSHHATLMSFTNLTSAGQLAALGVIAASGSYLEMALTQAVINMRYLLMSCSLSQKIDPNAPFFHRYFVAAGVTDEIFAITSCRPGKFHPFYVYGAMSVAIPGWGLGTLFGSLSGTFLPASLMSAFGIAIYGMFLAIIIPPTKKDHVIFKVVLLGMVLGCAFRFLPVLREFSFGFSIILITVLVAGLAAWLFPVAEEGGNEG